MEEDLNGLLIFVMFALCVSGMERNFKMQEGETFNISYDVTSIMHYGR